MQTMSSANTKRKMDAENVHEATKRRMMKGSRTANSMEMRVAAALANSCNKRTRMGDFFGETIIPAVKKFHSVLPSSSSSSSSSLPLSMFLLAKRASSRSGESLGECAARSAGASSSRRQHKENALKDLDREAQGENNFPIAIPLCLEIGCFKRAAAIDITIKINKSASKNNAVDENNKNICFH
eukprot:CAMPEP_0206460194 /NCGR_PEP_ID=MMETSP0324_2-20121206/24620_1 /ASSEMBLY_ACC=CAM_ASM_000836 /TAXON_ID=2866 /ORGANISM="Crypthecodinium cohnii, Strain Seligo" /LENGTH=183 /DNA_ID=CAMNT_0053931877 /DNA_START=474 /DNA_END=1025 /DNA_ORIENTATION=-